MAKLIVFLATLAVLLLLTEASIYRTTIEIDEENPRRQTGQCQEQIHRQHSLSHCQDFMRQQMRGRRDDDSQGRREHLEQCCDQLEQLDTQCRCQGLQRAVKEQQQGQRRGQQSQEGRRMLDVARDIPSMCNLQPRECQFSSPRVWF
ncbi:2S sulfur-rich seed storage protein 2-like [Tripterygium wilfordii]|uniref:2S sulfur-rich seed storage protein 2-like n=1 Tax=Tripterygium wilfordii TaxID=458696 RepID=A0A7J7C3D7_TRIWF|nr:2S sulfur-rich seed storage protein 2-like [Tripterygium wilfordii]